MSGSRRASSSSPWERRHGTARAVRRGGFIAVSPIAACAPDGSPLAADALGQARAIFSAMGRALGGVGASLADVVRLRVHYVDPGVADGFARALAEAFPAGAPALTTLHVVSLASGAFLLEVEADAVAPEAPRPRPPEPVWDEHGD